MKTLVAVVFTFLSLSLSAGVHDISHPLTLSEVLDIALANSPQTKKAWWNAQRAAAIVGSAKSEYFPQVDLEATYTHGKDFKFINGPDVSYTQLGADLSLSMLLFDFGVRDAKVDAAKAGLTAANWRNDFSIQKVILSALEHAHQVLHLEEALKYAQLSEQNARMLYELAKELNRVGLKSITDVYTSQTSLTKLEMAVIQKKSELKVSHAKLATSMGLDADTKIELAPITQVPSASNETLTALIEQAKKQRADLMQTHAELQEDLANEDKEQSSFYPTLQAVGSIGDSHYVHDSTNQAQYQIGLSLKVPLFSGFDTVYKNRMARAKSHATMEEIAHLELEIAEEVLSSKCAVEASYELLGLAEQSMNTALKAFEGVFELYKAGAERAISDLSQCLDDLVAARSSYSKIKHEALTAMVKLAYATGTICPYTGKTCLEKSS